MNTVGLSSCSVFLQICLAFLLRELAEIDKQLDQKTREKCCLCGLFVGLLKRGDDVAQAALASPPPSRRTLILRRPDDSQKNPLYFHNVRAIRANRLKPAICNFWPRKRDSPNKASVREP